MSDGVPRAFNDSRCDSTITGVGVLLAISGYPDPSRRKYVVSLEGGNWIPCIIVPTSEERPCFLIWRLLIHELVSPLSSVTHQLVLSPCYCGLN
ncbi:hypothetical protein AVEN_60387-1 [Araneus ventricosus]|uniref:Uncharacterized protein n=1 Tax=Araneus ventricosus TaxID=182803 RepID=A0A4Y2H3A2_ARAVE|nr:hypothetical protein AVEN_60387-1 [Araneus ventricosus]